MTKENLSYMPMNWFPINLHVIR